MYFGTPSSHGKFYKGLFSDTPVNHDLHWADRVKKENVMVKSQKKRGGGQEMTPDMFVKRPWTAEEAQQLKEAVMKHGPNNWEVVCRDRAFIEMIGNHTQEDIKTKWRTIEKARVRACKTRAMQGSGNATGTMGGFTMTNNVNQNLAIASQLRLKHTLAEEARASADIAQRVNAERAARLAAEKKAAIQLRERRKMEAKLAELKNMAGMSGAGAGSSHSLKRAASNSLLPPQGSSNGHYAPPKARPEDDMALMQQRLTSRSTAIQQSAATRLRARAILDSVRSSRRK